MFFSTSQVISIEVRDVHKHSYHLLDSVNLNDQEIYDVESKYIFDIQKNTMTTEFKNQLEFNAETTVEVDYSNGVYSFSFKDTDTKSDNLTYVTTITVDTTNRKVFYKMILMNYDVVRIYEFTDLDMEISEF